MIRILLGLCLLTCFFYQTNVQAQDEWVCEAFCVTQYFRPTFRYNSVYIPAHYTYRNTGNRVVTSNVSITDAWNEANDRCFRGRDRGGSSINRLAESYTKWSFEPASIRNSCFKAR